MAQFLVLIILYTINLGSSTTGSFFLFLFIHGMSIWHLLFLFLLSFLISYLSGKLAHVFFYSSHFVTLATSPSLSFIRLNRTAFMQSFIMWDSSILNGAFLLNSSPIFLSFVTISSTNSSLVVFESALNCRGFTVHLFILIIFISDHVLFRIE